MVPLDHLENKFLGCELNLDNYCLDSMNILEYNYDMNPITCTFTCL